MTKQIQNEEWMDQVDLQKIETADNCALIIDIKLWLSLLFWDHRFIVEKDY